MTAASATDLPERKALDGRVAQVRLAAGENLGRVVGLLVATNAATTLGHYLVPDYHDRAKQLHLYFRIIVQAALAHGQIYLGGGYCAAAVWLPSPADHGPTIPAYAPRLARVLNPRYLTRFRALDAARAEHRPSEDHFWLACLASHARAAAGPIGEVLSAHEPVLARTGWLGYAEASSPDAFTVLQDHGYQPVGGFVIGAEGPAVTRMRRLPQRDPARVAARTVPVPLRR